MSKTIKIFNKSTKIETCSLFNKTHYGIFKCTLDGKILKANLALIDMLGYNSEKDLLAANFHQDIHLKFEETPAPSENAILYIAPLKTENNTVIWAELNIWLTENKANETQYYEGLVREITDRKQFVEELNKTKKELQTTLTSIGDGVIVTDTEGRVTMLNEVAVKLTGWTQENAKGKMLTDIFNIINEFNRKPVKNPVKKVLSTGKVERMANHTILISKEGKEIPIADSAAPIINTNNEMFGVIMVFRDVSEKRQLMIHLEKNRNLYRSVFENTGTATAISERDFTISMVNRKMEEMSGYRKEEIEGKLSYLDLFIEKDKDKMEKYHWQRRNPKTNNIPPHNYEAQFVDKSGNQKNVLMTVGIIPNTDKSVISMLDISERKQSEKKARYLAYHDELTGLYNRAFMEESLERLNTERQLPISIIMGDINGLKLVNDAFGHYKGDQLLIKTGQIILNSCRQEDIIARWGGDEFILLLPQTQEEDAQKITDRINKACLSVQDDMIKPSIALGFATKKEPDQDLWEVLNEAEGWMYKNKLFESQSVRRSIISSLENTLVEKSYETQEHAEHLKIMARKMANIIGLPGDKIDDLILLATLHDIGKIAIPDSILLKPEKLTSDEWAKMKKHSEIGYRIAKSAAELTPISQEILHHHEWWNGQGYPQGLVGEEIPLFSRIIAIIDAYDVMTHERPYKKAMSQQEAITELRKFASIQFDPELVQIFIEKVIE